MGVQRLKCCRILPRNASVKIIHILLRINADFGFVVYKGLKGLSHEIFMVICWLEWIHLGLKGNRFWFLNFKDVSSILDSNFKFLMRSIPNLLRDS
jgi:hypothetical protein